MTLSARTDDTPITETDGSILLSIATALVDHKGVTPLDLQTPLQQVIDVDAVETVCQPLSTESSRSPVTVTFEIDDCIVTVRNGGGVSITRTASLEQK